MKKTLFIGCNALGDTLCTTPSVRAFRESNPDQFIIYVTHNAEYCRVLDGNPDIDMVLYNETLGNYGRDALSEEWILSLPLDLDEPSSVFHFDMTVLGTNPASYVDHIAAGFSRLLGIPPGSVRPVVTVSESERRLAQVLTHGPYAVFSTFSNANPKIGGGLGMKDWPAENWARLAQAIRSRWGLELISIGSERNPPRNWPGVRSLHGLPIKVVAALLEGAECVITLENGIAHLCAGVDARMVELYAKMTPLVWAFPREMTHKEAIYEDPRLVPVEQVMSAMERVCARR